MHTISHFSLLSVQKRETNSTLFLLPSFITNQWDACNFSVWQYPKVRLQMYHWIMLPLNLNNNHWALLIADVRNGTVGIADSMPGNESGWTWKVVRAEVRTESTGWCQQLWNYAFDVCGSSDQWCAYWSGWCKICSVLPPIRQSSTNYRQPNVQRRWRFSLWHAFLSRAQWHTHLDSMWPMQPLVSQQLHIYSPNTETICMLVLPLNYLMLH